MAFDDVIIQMGEFGRYQQRIYLLLCLPAIICAFHKLAMVFISARMNFRCLLPNENKTTATYNMTQELFNKIYEVEEESGITKACKIRRNITNFYNSTVNLNTEIKSTLLPFENTTCSEYVYDKTIFHSTTISEWDLVCHKDWQRVIADSMFMVGVMLGSIIFGILSDKYGRKPTFFLSLAIMMVGGFLVAISPEFISFVIFRMIVGASTSGVFLVAYVMALEMVGPKYRLIAGVCCQFFATAGYIIPAFFAYFIRDWRMLQLALTLPSLLFISYWWFIPESARWLLTKGRGDEAKEILLRASKENKAEIKLDNLDVLLNEKVDDTKSGQHEEASIFDLFRNPNLRRKSILLFFNWTVNSGTYYGLSWKVSDLEGNFYVIYVLSGLVEIPAYLFLIFTLNRWGRKSILCGCMITCGIALLCTTFFKKGDPGIVVLSLIAKLAITSSYGTIYLFTTEQFPTVIRNVALGACSTSGRIGGIIAPGINYLSKVWAPLPFFIFGISALIGGAFSLLLPETLNEKLPETIEDGEQFGKEN